MTNIGVAPQQVALQLRASLGNLLWQWRNTNLLNPRALGIALHAETVRIHPFVDGNGRTTRLLADLAFVAAQIEHEIEVAEQLRCDWTLGGDDKRGTYISLLRGYDADRSAESLVAFVPVVRLVDA